MFNRTFCLWLVSSQDGKVRKLKFTMRSVLWGLLCLAIGVGALTAVLGDYGRAQMLRAKHFISLQITKQERDKLSSENQELKVALGEIQSEIDTSLVYKKKIDSKINQLHRVLDSALALSGVTGAESKRVTRALGEDGLGGFESECVSEDCDTEIKDYKDSLDPVSFQSEYSEKILDRLTHIVDLLDRFPLGSPIAGKITSGFGVRGSPFTGKLAFHKGIDIELDTGDPIFCTGSGEVIEVDRDVTYGLYVDVQHTPQIVTRYAHLSKIKVKVGQKVSRGTVLGAGGSTGRSTGPHLHYEIRINGKPRNPSAFLRLAERLKATVISA
jgi:murein DD-endopeptidase MepM/ murein hydrolase activator NlpD